MIIGYGLDLGSTSIKGAALHRDGSPRHPVEVLPFPEPVSGLPAGHFEVDPLEVLSRARQVLERLVVHQPGGTDLWICSQMGGVILADPAGNPLTRYLSWRDQRSLASTGGQKPPMETLRDRLGPDQIASLGGEWKPGSATVLLGCLPDLPRGAFALSLGDWVIAQWTGSPPRAHATLAIGLRNLMTDDWHHEAFERLGLSELRWPDWAETNQVVGKANIGTSVLAVHPAFGDQQTALYGADLALGDLSVNASTGAQVSQLQQVFRPGDYQSRAYFDRLILETITHIPAGRSLQALVDLFTECSRGSGQAPFDPWPYLRKTQETDYSQASVPRVDLSFFASALGHEGALSGLTLENLTVGHLLHGALQAMADGFLRCAQRLDPRCPWPTLVLTGGLTQGFPRLRALVEQRFAPARIREPVSGEETLKGLAKLAQSAARTSAAAGRGTPVGERLS